jgi:hypothetical protein
MRQDVDQYVHNCHNCQCGKRNQQTIHDWQKPLEVPYEPWQDLSNHFVVGLPEYENFNGILVVVDRPAKMMHLISCHNDTGGQNLG